MKCKSCMMPSPLIELRGISVRREGRVILDKVNLTVNRGDFLAITGPNGGGKTTLLKVMLKLMKPTSGEVIYLGEDELPIQRLDIGYLPQKNSIDSRFPMTVKEVIATGLLANKSLSRSEKRNRVQEMLSVLHLNDRADYSIGNVSGGQLQRALIGRAIINRPAVLLLDEPLSYLDRHFIDETYCLLEKLSKETTIVLVSHEMSRIADMANRHILVDHTVRPCHAHSHHFTEPLCDV